VHQLSEKEHSSSFLLYGEAVDVEALCDLANHINCKAHEQEECNPEDEPSNPSLW